MLVNSNTYPALYSAISSMDLDAGATPANDYALPFNAAYLGRVEAFLAGLSPDDLDAFTNGCEDATDRIKATGPDGPTADRVLNYAFTNVIANPVGRGYPPSFRY